MSKGTFVALSPKCYMAYNETTEKSKLGSKGVPRLAKLELGNFLSRLYFGTEHIINVRSLRMVNNRMSRTVQKKSALNDLYLKFGVHHDRISCSPLSENGIVL